MRPTALMMLACVARALVAPAAKRPRSEAKKDFDRKLFGTSYF